MTEADQLLLDNIRRGDESAWSQLVRRYQGRLVAFATQQTRNRADAEDAVQDCFVTFLKQLKSFRGVASLETFLFQVLRHRIIDQHRKQVRRPCRLGSELSATDDVTAAWASPGPTPSGYAHRHEVQSRQQDMLTSALARVTEQYQARRDFDKLRVVEMLFYAQLPPTQIFDHTGVRTNTIATIKRRVLQRIREAMPPESEADPLTDTLLTNAWEAARPSCPKRSTVGAYLLGSLDPGWHDYVAFHLDTLGCGFCSANFDDLREQTCNAESEAYDRDVNARILRSSVGFLKRESS